MSLLSDFDTFSIRLREALNETSQSTTPDAFSSVELQSNELRKFSEEVKSLRQDRTERKDYASKLYWLVSLWLVTILLFVLLQGIGQIPFTSQRFSLPNQVLVVLIGTTTANVAAFLLVVVRYLFRSTK